MEMATSVRREVVLAAPPDEVWEALTEPERLAEWFASDVEREPDGATRFGWADGESRRAVYEQVEEPRLLAFRWSDEEGPETRVELTLVEVPEGTRLTVVESGPQACAGEWAWALELRAACVLA